MNRTLFKHLHMSNQTCTQQTIWQHSNIVNACKFLNKNQSLYNVWLAKCVFLVFLPLPPKMFWNLEKRLKKTPTHISNISSLKFHALACQRTA